MEKLRTYERVEIASNIRSVLAVNPTLTSQSRVKRLDQPAPSQYRLRVRDYRVFYEVDDATVLIARVLIKADAERLANEYRGRQS